MTYKLEPVSETTRVVNPAAQLRGLAFDLGAQRSSRRQAE